MIDQDTIRAAVELADGFGLTDDGKGFGLMIHKLDGTDWTWCFGDFDEPPDFLKDALAAQLVRQVNALDEYAIHIEPGKTILCGVTYTDKGFESHHMIDVCEDEDSTENTTKVIVDSKVLK